MDWADSDLLGPGWPDELAGVNADLAQLVAAAADLCRKPLRHGVVLKSGPDDPDCTLELEVRSSQGNACRSTTSNWRSSVAALRAASGSISPWHGTSMTAGPCSGKEATPSGWMVMDSAASVRPMEPSSKR